MNQKEFNEVIIRQTDRCKSMLVAKGAEYAPRAVKNTAVDRLAHFKKAAVVLNTTPRAALMGMLSKHLISVSDMCMCEQQYSKEQWDEKITDSINYFLILCAIVEEVAIQQRNCLLHYMNACATTQLRKKSEIFRAGSDSLLVV